MDEVKTGVDELMELVRREGRISIPDIAKRMRQPDSVIQNWVDFLVEEKLLGIEYKFTTPFIYPNAAPKSQNISVKTDDLSFESIRRDFVSHAREKGIPPDKLPSLWQNHLIAAIDSRTDFFHQECKKRGVGDVEELFKHYKEKILVQLDLHQDIKEISGASSRDVFAPGPGAL